MKMNLDSEKFEDERKYYYRCCGSEFFIQIIEIILFIMFAGLMNGLTLGYMSMNPVDLEVLIKSGSPKHSRFACMPLNFCCAKFCLRNMVLFVFVTLFFFFCTQILQPRF